MFDECNKNKLPDNVYINNIILNKKKYHGSLTEGIYNNMLYALEYFTFKYFIICSSRNYFDNNMTLYDLDNVIKQPIHMIDYNYTVWHWPTFINTKLAKFFINQNKKLYSSSHEGLLFTYSCIQKIVHFLENNLEIKNDLFNFEASVEEFALQSIAINIEDNFYYIGNGCCNNDHIKSNDENDELKFMYKVDRIENL